jgi:hypothetical protein
MHYSSNCGLKLLLLAFRWHVQHNQRKELLALLRVAARACCALLLLLLLPLLLLT